MAAARVTPRRGRPSRAEAPATRVIRFRVTEDEYAKIRRLAEENGQCPHLLSRDLTLDAAEEHAEAILPNFVAQNFRDTSS